MKKVEEQEPLNYKEYTFRPNQTLEVQAPILSIARQFAEEVLSKEGVGTERLTAPRFEWLHKETGVPAKPNMSKEKLEKNYQKVFSFDKTIKAEGAEYIKELGKKALSFINLLNSVHKDNIDSGKGVLISELQAEMNQQPVGVPSGNVEQAVIAPGPVLVSDEEE